MRDPRRTAAAGLAGGLAALLLLPSCTSHPRLKSGTAAEVGCASGTSVLGARLEPYRLAGGLVELVPVCLEGRGPFLFIVDTGAAATLVDSRLATRLGLRGAGVRPVPVAVGCATADRQVSVGLWSADGIALRPQEMLTAAIAGFNRRPGPVGVLGGDVLSRFGAVRLDFGRQELTVLAPEADPVRQATIVAGDGKAPAPPLLLPARPAAAMALTVLRTPSSALVTATARYAGAVGHPFLVASGWARSAVSASLATSSGFAASDGHSSLSGAGCRQRVPTGRSGPWTAGGVGITAGALDTGLPPALSRQGADGLIGADVLRAHGPVVLDYRTATLWLGRHPGTAGGPGGTVAP